MKRYIIASLAAVAVFAGAAFAASLEVNAGTLQAGQGDIGQCIEDPDGAVGVSYGPATFTGSGWTVQAITLDHDGKCADLDYSVVVTGGTWTTSTESDTFGPGPATVTFDAPFDANEASLVHLVIRTASS